MRYFTAIIGALFIFIAVFFLCGMFITPFLPKVFQTYVNVDGFGTNNLVGVILGLAASASSFYATLKMKR